MSSVRNILRGRLAAKLLFLGMVFAVPLMLSIGAQAAAITHAVDPAHGEWYVNFIIDQAKEFYKQTGIQVNISAVGDHRSQILVWAAGNALPDAVDIVSDNGLLFFRAGLFLDLKDLFDQSTDIRLNDLLPIALSAFTAPEPYDIEPGAVFAFPYMLYNVNAAYNVRLLENAGLPSPNTLGAGWNWDKAYEYAQKLTVDKNSDGKTDQWGLFMPRIMSRWGILFRHAGNPIFDRDYDPTAVQLNTPAARQTLQWVVDMAQSGYIAWENWQFNEGRAVLSFNGASNIGMLMSRYNQEVDHIPFPYGPAGANGAEFQVFGTAINKKSKNIDLTWQWLSFLWGDRDRIIAACKQMVNVPALRSVISIYDSQINTWTKHSQIVIESANYKGSGLRPIVRDGRIGSTVEQTINQALALTMPLEQALVEAQERTTAILKEIFGR
ncbi:MAG TPA: extracellular solute-binding protein [Firmicutes bacterium]|nr:extracellular solute-binding protein [Bacillota bacterium]